ncbi:MAG: SDR family oxidoreductase [Dehalococcoidia bacterium]
MADKRFDGKVAIVTGGAFGIGGATSRRLARDGAKVLIVDVEEQGAADNVKRIEDTGGTALYMGGDVASEETARAMVERAVSEWGRLDFLVQNAYGGGRERAGSAVEVSPKAWDEGMGLLTRALFLGAKYGVPEMEKAGGGSIVNISSVHGILQAPRSLIYEAGKAAVIGMTRQMAIDFGPQGIRVNAIAPGHIVTERMQKGWDSNGNKEGFRFFELQYPVRRTGVPDDIANSIAFLCSDEASFITGVTLPVDGGLSIQLQENLAMDLKDYSREHPDMQFPYGKGDSPTRRD